MYPDGQKFCATAEILELNGTAASVQCLSLLDIPARSVANFIAATSLVQLDVSASEITTWVCFTKTGGTPMQDEWSSLWQFFDIRVDRKGVLRPKRHTYAYCSIGFHGPETKNAFTQGVKGKSFTEYTIDLMLKAWHDAHERDDLDLKPILPNTRMWIKGDPARQWGYSDDGDVLEFRGATLPEPEEHFLNFEHLIPSPPPDPAEEAERDELAALPLDERVARLSAIAKKAQRRKKGGGKEEGEGHH